MAKPNEEEILPKEVADEVKRIRSEGETTEEIERPEEPEQEIVKISRRAQKEQERTEATRAAIAEAAEAAAEKAATKAMEEARRERESDRQAIARLEGLLQGSLQSRQTAVEPRRDAVDARDESARLMREATAHLKEGEMDLYHEKLMAAQDARQQHRDEKRRAAEPPPQAQQQGQRPPWVTAVESKFSDVLTHAQGIAAVSGFLGMDPAQMGPEKLEKAFKAAQKHLGLAVDDTATNARQRQVMAGGPVNGRGRTPPPAKGEATISVPKNYKEIARRAGMTPDQYIKAYATMNPGEISGE